MKCPEVSVIDKTLIIQGIHSLLLSPLHPSYIINCYIKVWHRSVCQRKLTTKTEFADSWGQKVTLAICHLQWMLLIKGCIRTI